MGTLALLSVSLLFGFDVWRHRSTPYSKLNVSLPNFAQGMDLKYSLVIGSQSSLDSTNTGGGISQRVKQESSSQQHPANKSHLLIFADSLFPASKKDLTKSSRQVEPTTFPLLSPLLPNITHAHFPRCSSCAVVSASGYLLNSSVGDAIDSHACVLRINTSPVEGFESDVGRRTTIRFVSQVSAQWLHKNPAFADILADKHLRSVVLTMPREYHSGARAVDLIKVVMVGCIDACISKKRVLICN